MSRDMRSPWLARPVLKQPRRHTASRETSREPRPLTTWEEDYALTLDREVDGRTGLETHPVSEVLGDDDLALRPNSMSHTLQV